MRFKKSFGFTADSCPKVNAPFWRDVDASIMVLWGSATVKLIEEESSVTKQKTSVIKIVIEAKTIPQLCNCCFDLAQSIYEYKANHPEFKFYKYTLTEPED